MTEKRYTCSELNNCQYAVRYTKFEEIYGEENIFHNLICEVNTKKQAQKVVDLLNEHEETIHELETRNKRQYNLLTEITDLMMKRDWKSLEKIVEDWEESDKLLQAEWGNCGDV